MPATVFLLLVLLPLPQLVDRTKEPAQPSLPPSQLTAEQRADILMARKMYREAAETYVLALDREPNASRLYNKLGIAHHHQLRLDDAKKYYERAMKLDKNFSQAINNLGTIYYAKGKYKKAAKTYQKALKVSPNSASIHSNLGTAYFARRKYKKASEEYLIALRLNPDVFEIHGSGGTLLQERSVQERAKYYYFMAKSYAAVERYDRALLYLRKALEEGYKNRKKIPSEPEFQALLENPQFQALVFPEQTAELRP